MQKEQISKEKTILKKGGKTRNNANCLNYNGHNPPNPSWHSDINQHKWRRLIRQVTKCSSTVQQ